MAKKDSMSIMNEYKNAPQKEKIESNRKLKVAIIGTGWIADAHVNRYKEMSDVEIVALVYPDEEECKKANLEGDAIYEYINAEITKINKKLAAYKHINKLEIRTEPFEKTTTRKIRRNLVK